MSRPGCLSQWNHLFYQNVDPISFRTQLTYLQLLFQFSDAVRLALGNKKTCDCLEKDLGLGSNMPFHNLNHMLDRISSPMKVLEQQY